MMNTTPPTAAESPTNRTRRARVRKTVLADISSTIRSSSSPVRSPAFRRLWSELHRSRAAHGASGLGATAYSVRGSIAGRYFEMTQVRMPCKAFGTLKGSHDTAQGRAAHPGKSERLEIYPERAGLPRCHLADFLPFFAEVFHSSKLGSMAWSRKRGDTWLSMLGKPGISRRSPTTLAELAHLPPWKPCPERVA